ncbi:hypothetical protein LXA43DRAFT_1037408 [Ganoderma leucocontextum]|nr:hypothetical protein LXA43DRAFT_1037408 [Ganoderma leucocontextum]
MHGVCHLTLTTIQWDRREQPRIHQLTGEYVRPTTTWLCAAVVEVHELFSIIGRQAVKLPLSNVVGRYQWTAAHLLRACISARGSDGFAFNFWSLHAMASSQSRDTTNTPTKTPQPPSLSPSPIPSVTFTSSEPTISQDIDRSPQVRKELPQRPDVQRLNDDFSETTELLNAAEASAQKYTGRRSVNYLNKAGATLSAIQTDVSNVQSVASPLQAVMETEPGKAIRQTISAIVDGIPGLLKVLDDVAQIHPFIKIAVGAFRVAVELDLKRRDNDKKISLMFVEMRDMMAVLVQLKDINKDKRAGEDNTTISGRMQDLVDKTEQDIRKCANSCNAYAKKKLLSKVVHSSSWSDEFKGYIQGFTDRRREFELALSIYIGHAVNTANDKLVTIEEKMDRVLRYLDACMSPEERELTKLVDDHGGPDAVMQNESVLRELFESRVSGAGISGPERKGRYGVVDEFSELQKELQMDVRTAVRENMEQFQAKFIIQQRELEEELRRTMHREGDRIIDAVISGPHDKILDPDVHEIWKEMRWRGSVKDRHFVLALRDYFREKLEQIRRVKSGTTPIVPSRQLNDQEEWTLEYINVTRVQPIIEAFDDDASGFITVAEVNTFTTARPENWSLLHWLAYWAVGHQMSMSDYAGKIDVLLAKMFALKGNVLPANRNAMEQYLYYVWTIVTMLTTAFRRVEVDEQLLQRFEDYTRAEEKRLSENLKTAKYDIDAQDTLDLIRGPGRIEKHVFPLLYLLLKRDFEIMRLARTQCLHVDELYDSMSTILWVFGAFNDRHDDLADLFKQQKLDPAQQFKIFAFEMFKYWHDEEEIWSIKKLKEATFLELAYEDSSEAQNVDPSSVINHPLQSTEELFNAHHFVESEADREADIPVRRLLGHWSGFCARGDLYPSQAMLSLDLHVSSTDAKQFYCKGIAPNGTDWNLTGEYAISEEGKVQYTFSITYVARFPTQNFAGELDESGATFSGSWGYGDKPFTFIFKRLSSEIMRFYPTPTELAENKARALWRFAIAATAAQACRKMGSWSWLRQRWQTGQRYAELVIRRDISPLAAEETVDLARCQRSMTPEEARLYQIFRDLRQRSIPVHWEIYCDVCRDVNIRGSRIVCVSCGMKTTVDLCDKEECLMSEIRLDVRDDLTSPHLPSHDILKLRAAIHPYREYGEVYRTAQFALKTVRQIFADLASSDGPSEGAVGKQPPKCIKCGECTSPPCWYCIECEENAFVCVSCDAKHGGITAGEHKKTHALVRCQSINANVDAESERAAQLNAHIDTLETKLKDVQHQVEDSFAGVDARITVTQDRLSGRMASLDERLQRIEDLLLDLGQRAFRSRTGDEPLAASQRLVRSQTLPAPRESSIPSESESDFSAWVRQMRRTT